MIISDLPNLTSIVLEENSCYGSDNQYVSTQDWTLYSNNKLTMKSRCYRCGLYQIYHL